MDTKKMEEISPKAIVVGGSIAGLSCAHSLITAGWEVIVIEKSVSPPAGSPTGAGLGLEPQAVAVIDSWLGDPIILENITIPLTSESHQVFDSEKNIRNLVRDDNFTYRCGHWTDIHSVIYRAIPPGIVLWGHRFISICSFGEASVRIEVEVLETNETVEIAGNLLIAADGILSSIRQHFIPNHKLRYPGYSAWRGVVNFSDDENTIISLRRAYPDLGKCVYFTYANGNQCTLLEIGNKRLNWVWYFKTSEPQREGNSLTKKVTHEMVEKMREEARRIWNPALAQLMEETSEPFINVIYDSNPLPRLFWENVVLVGDAAHPTTAHAARSTNMAILDAQVLGICLRKRGLKNLRLALEEYQTIRHPVVSKQVMQSREMGCLKLGLPLSDGNVVDLNVATPWECYRLLHKSIDFYDDVLTTR